ncbi:uncharacterized protein LOC142829675 isoform X2 [Pelodiscus sinensis]|uniref:uncharacterized protein LOC142829675 isoform X2 n=1 Tax=Pelodiscus sinensis TaxID=13735 RepID=UPI003F6B0993
MAELSRLLNIHPLRTTVYHPQTDGLVERFNQTLKTMLRKFVAEDPRHWDKLLPALLFAIREVPQASTGFSPFELLYGRQPRGILDLLRESWEEQESRVQGTVPYILQLRERLRKVGEFARANLLQAQEVQARYYNRGAKLRSFEPGDHVLVLLPSRESKLLARWQGPFEVVRRIGTVDYEVRLPGRRREVRLYHINLLKEWKTAEGLLVTPYPPDPELGPAVEDLQGEAQITMGPELSPVQRGELQRVAQRFEPFFSTRPGRVRTTHHHIATRPGHKVRDQHRPLPRKMWETVQRELQTMLEMGVVEESHSEWKSPIVLVPKPDGTTRFCIDFRKVNAISRFDAYPMPRTEELLERLGQAEYFSILDMTKGYWQIPLTPASKEKTAFPTPWGLFQFVTMPFGLHGAAATFQRLMDRLLQPHHAYAAAYIDDVVIYSPTWTAHLQHLEAVLKSLKEAGLTANPRKCQLGRREVTYLGYTVGQGTVRPLVDKVKAVQECKTPATKKQVRQFLGLAGYYRRFIPGFADIAAPLSDLTKSTQPNKVQWSADCEVAFRTLKDQLTKAPVLFHPDFSKPFLLQTDASERGLGAVLSQQAEGGEHPIVYLSRKLFPREQNYATIEKEALAIKWAVDALRYYLLGNTFQVVTDHAPLKWLNSMKETNPRLMRWYLSLQPYNFSITHRPGKAHTNADFLSRVGEEETGTDEGIGTHLSGGVCDGAAPPRTQAQGNHLGPGAERAPPTQPYWACSKGSQGIKGFWPAQKGQTVTRAGASGHWAERESPGELSVLLPGLCRARPQRRSRRPTTRVPSAGPDSANSAAARGRTATARRPTPTGGTAAGCEQGVGSDPGQGAVEAPEGSGRCGEEPPPSQWWEPPETTRALGRGPVEREGPDPPTPAA